MDLILSYTILNVGGMFWIYYYIYYLDLYFKEDARSCELVTCCDKKRVKQFINSVIISTP